MPTSTPSTPEAPHPHNTVIAMVAAVLLLCGVSAWLFFSARQEQTQITFLPLLPVHEALALTGVGENKYSIPILFYEYSFVDNTLVEKPVDLSAYPAHEVTSYVDVSPARQWATFLGWRAPSSQSYSAADMQYQVYAVDLSSAASSSELYGALAGGTNRTHTEDPKRYPVINDMGDILYMSFAGEKGKEGGVTNAEQWNIRMLPNGGENSTVAQGLYPKWINNTQFVYLKSDGLYLHTTTAATEQKLWGSDEPLGTDTTIGVSGDGGEVAISSLKKATVTILALPTTPGAEPTVVGVIPNAKGITPVFSPDGKLLALAGAVVNTEQTSVSFVQFFDLSTFAQSMNRPPIFLPNIQVGRAELTEWYPL